MLTRASAREPGWFPNRRMWLSPNQRVCFPLWRLTIFRAIALKIYIEPGPVVSFSEPSFFMWIGGHRDPGSPTGWRYCYCALCSGSILHPFTSPALPDGCTDSTITRPCCCSPVNANCMLDKDGGHTGNIWLKLDLAVLGEQTGWVVIDVELLEAW